MKSTKLKMQDIVVYGLVSGVGLILFFVMFFTDLVFSNEEESAVPALAQSSFNNINPQVKSDPITEHDSKVDLYDDELSREAELRRKESEKEQHSTTDTLRQKITDLSRYLEKTGNKQRETVVAESAQPKSNTRNSKTPLQKAPQPAVAKVKTIKRPRRADPIFGEFSPPEARNTEHETLNPERGTQNTEPGTFRAIIHGDQVIREGSRMTIRTTEAISIGQCFLPANSRLTGVVTIQTQRIIVHFTICQKEKNPIRLSIYDHTDGNEGLYVESLNDGQELKKEALGDAVGETASRLGIPVVDKIARSAGNKKLDSPTISLQSGTAISLKSLNK